MLKKDHPLKIIEAAIMDSITEEEIDEYIQDFRDEEEWENDQPYPMTRDLARALVNLGKINTAWAFESEILNRMLSVKAVIK
jgi:hypothetical protein